MAERCAGVTYDIGKSMIIRGEHSSAACWLQRSYEALPQPEIGRIGENRRELQFAVLLARGKCSLSSFWLLGYWTLSFFTSPCKHVFTTRAWRNYCFKFTWHTWASKSCLHLLLPQFVGLLLILRQEYGNRLPVILLNLDVISKSPSPDSQRYYASTYCYLEWGFFNDLYLVSMQSSVTWFGQFLSLNRIMKCSLYIFSYAYQNYLTLDKDNSTRTSTKQMEVSSTPASVAVLRFRANKSWSSELALDILKQLLIQRLVLHNDIFILEKCFVTFVWMQTALSELTAGLNSLLGLIEKLEESLRKPFSEEAAQASLIVSVFLQIVYELFLLTKE